MQLVGLESVVVSPEFRLHEETIAKHALSENHKVHGVFLHPCAPLPVCPHFALEERGPALVEDKRHLQTFTHFSQAFLEEGSHVEAVVELCRDQHSSDFAVADEFVFEGFDCLDFFQFVDSFEGAGRLPQVGYFCFRPVRREALGFVRFETQDFQVGGVAEPSALCE